MSDSKQNEESKIIPLGYSIPCALVLVIILYLIGSEQFFKPTSYGLYSMLILGLLITVCGVIADNLYQTKDCGLFQIPLAVLSKPAIFGGVIIGVLSFFISLISLSWIVGVASVIGIPGFIFLIYKIETSLNKSSPSVKKELNFNNLTFFFKKRMLMFIPFTILIVISLVLVFIDNIWGKLLLINSFILLMSILLGGILLFFLSEKSVSLSNSLLIAFILACFTIFIMGSLINIAKPLWFSSLSLDKKIMLAIYDKQSEKINTYIDDPIFESDSGSYKIKMLLYAYEDENNTMISLLKNKKGIEINSCDQTGKTALHYAALDANRQLVEILLKNGADITMVDKRGETALHFAVKSKNRENRKLATIEKLLEYNVPFENKNIENKSAYDIAKEKSLDDIVKLLKNKQP